MPCCATNGSRSEAQDVIIKEDLRYRLCDPCYALWLKAARGPVSAVATPLLFGEESEKEVARELARQGVSLVYQSRASRGAFDLLAVYQTHQIGLQVKRIKKYPAYIAERRAQPGMARRDRLRSGRRRFDPRPRSRHEDQAWPALLAGHGIATHPRRS